MIQIVIGREDSRRTGFSARRMVTLRLAWETCTEAEAEQMREGQRRSSPRSRSRSRSPRDGRGVRNANVHSVHDVLGCIELSDDVEAARRARRESMYPKVAAAMIARRGKDARIHKNLFDVRGERKLDGLMKELNIILRMDACVEWCAAHGRLNHVRALRV